MPEKPTATRPDEPTTAETRRDWDIVQEDVNQSKTDRLRVSGGWLYRTVVEGVGVGLVYVPGPVD